MEHLIIKIATSGFNNIFIAEAQSSYGNYYKNREVLKVAEYIGYSTKKNYKIIDLTEEKVPYDYGGRLGKHFVGPTWRDADFRISFAKNKKLIAIITNRSDYTADFLILNLRKHGINYWRFNTEDFPQQVTVNWQFSHREIQGYFVHPKGKIEFDEIGSIWYRRPVTPVPSDNVPIWSSKSF